MSDQRLFSVPKVGLVLDSYAPGTEKRRDETAKIIKASFRVDPFDSKLATAIDDGLDDNSGVKAALFKLTSAEPKPHIEQLKFGLSCPRQNMEIFASPDTDESRIVLLQVKIGGVYAKAQKDGVGYSLHFTGSFGPVDRDTLEFLQYWYQSMQFVSFEASEPDLSFSAEEPDDDEDGEDDGPADTALAFDEEEAKQEPEPEGVKAAKKNTADRTREKGHRYPGKKKTAAKRGKGKK